MTNIIIIVIRPERIRRTSNYCNIRDPCADYLSNPMFNSLHQRGGIRCSKTQRGKSLKI